MDPELYSGDNRVTTEQLAQTPGKYGASVFPTGLSISLIPCNPNPKTLLM